MLKRVAILLFCLMMVFIATFGFVVGVVAVPTIYSYAETTNNFEPIRDQSDAVYAFQAYCKSRDLTIEGSITDAVTSYTTDAYNYACNKIGVNPTELQAQIQAEYDQSGKPVKFLFSTVGIDAFNRIFSQFLQDNELQVGDTVNKQVYNGALFIDDNGNSCNVTVLDNSADANSYYYDPRSNPTKLKYLGSPFIKPGYADALTWATNNPNNAHYVEFTYRNNSYYIDCHLPSGSNTSAVCVYAYAYACYYSSRTYNEYNNYYDTYYNIGGFPTIFYIEGKGFCYGSINTCNKANSSSTPYYGINVRGYISSVTADNTTVNITSNNTVINNNNYEGDTIINYEGDVIVEPDSVPPGGTDPGWDIGGGGGTATDGNGNTWNIQFPDFELPDLNIDWSINGLGEKFPFSIPFDLVALVTVLNAEPQAPRFEGTVNFGFTTWDYDINLQQFDSVAQACRIAELLLLVVGLILVTRSIIKG